MSTQFNVVHTKGDMKGLHDLTLTDFGSSNLANVTFEHYNDPTTEIPSRIEVSYLKSNHEGQGHARRLMQHLYDRYPKSHIDWGQTIHPASAHLAGDFERRYYARTSYEIPEDDENDW